MEEMFKGILLYGIPGTGKTLIARWIASELKIPVRIVAPHDVKGSLLGESERNVRRIFEDARRFAPCILVFDEMDDLFKSRLDKEDVGAGIRSSLLSEMDGFNDQAMVFVIGTTNRRDVVDRAFLRPSRLGLSIEVPVPEREDRIKILRHYRDRLQIADNGFTDDLIGELAEKGGIPVDPNLTDSGNFAIVGDHLYALCRRVFLRKKRIDPATAKKELEAIVRNAH
jgi:SpoVK/Ycf46/Vps4 family AAA+-type ATPase